MWFSGRIIVANTIWFGIEVEQDNDNVDTDDTPVDGYELSPAVWKKKKKKMFFASYLTLSIFTIDLIL